MTSDVDTTAQRPASVPFEFARQQKAMLLADGALAIAESAQQSVVLEVVRWLGTTPLVRRLADADFDALLTQTYGENAGGSAAVMEDIKDSVGLEEAAEALEETADLLDGDNDAPIIRLLNAVLAEALKEKASDIHIEPYEKDARVRFRLDGVLRTVLTPSVQIAPLLISRVKVMARLDIAERRLPQDGRMSVKLGGRSVDLRVSTMPSSYGEPGSDAVVG